MSSWVKVVGMEVAKDGKTNLCETCCVQNAKREAVPKQWGTRAEAKLDIVHTDVLGPVHQTSPEGVLYAIGFIDSSSRFAVMYPMKTRDEVLHWTQRFFCDVGKPRTLVSDGALEFKSKDFRKLCAENGTRQEFSAPYTPEENGKIERIWGTVTGMARCLLATSGLAKTTWPFALATAFFVKNRCLHSVIKMTPYEMFHGNKPDVSGLHPFGCRVFVLKEHRKKLENKADVGIFLGYSRESQGFIVGSPDGQTCRRVFVSRNVQFDDKTFPAAGHSSKRVDEQDDSGGELLEIGESSPPPPDPSMGDDISQDDVDTLAQDETLLSRHSG